jgi:hypothetical protein
MIAEKNVASEATAIKAILKAEESKITLKKKSRTFRSHKHPLNSGGYSI